MTRGHRPRLGGRRAVAAFHAALPGYEPTPLVELPGLAAGLRAALPRLPGQGTVVLLSTEGRAANPSV
ncbi:hypothetical protein AB0J52_30580 [Spirillospora sp. NPDC049652]